MKWYNEKIYQLMCEKATEIQELWNPEFGDLYLFNNQIELLIDIASAGEGNTWFRHSRYSQWAVENRTKSNTIWLPRQDRLQEMIIDKYRNNQKCTKAYHMRGDGFLSECMMDDIIRWSDSDNKIWQGGKNKWWKSMEQLWLGFVMSERYSKVWSETEWVKI